MSRRHVIQRNRGAVGPHLVADLGRGGRFSVWYARDGEEEEDDAEDDEVRVVGGRYRLTRLLGAGSMGEVWAARHLETGRRVALKLLRVTFGGVEARVRFAREATLLARLKHPAIASLYEYDLHATPPFIAMELCRGRPLSEMVAEEGPLGPEHGADVITDIAEALDLIHARGVVHRDVKPSNIMVGRDGRAKLIDFGIAKPPASAMDLTIHGMLGTVHYVSPQQCCRGSAVDGRSDVWSLAVTAYHALTGRFPFESDDLVDLSTKIMRAPPTPARCFAPHLPSAVDDVIVRALAKDRSERYASAGRFAEALQTAIAPLVSGSHRRLDDDELEVG